jgi:hypothetical protein
MEKLNVLRVERCEDEGPTRKFDHEYVIWYENKGDYRLEWKLSNIQNREISKKINKTSKKIQNLCRKFYWSFSPGWCYQSGLKRPPAAAHNPDHVEDV